MTKNYYNDKQQEINKLLDNLESALVSNQLNVRQQMRLLQIANHLHRTNNSLFTKENMITEIRDYLDWVIGTRIDDPVDREKEVKGSLNYILKIIKRYNQGGID